MEPTQPPYEPTQFPYNLTRPPYEPTQISGDPYSPYVGLPPIPPPPPVPKRRRGWMVGAIVLIIVVISTTAVIAYMIGKGQVVSQQHLPTSSSPTTTHTPAQASTPTQAIQTSTPGVAQALQTADFNMFIKAFAQAMANKDYSDIQKATDTQNFQEIPLEADGISTWNDTYNGLTTGNLGFVVQYPPITAEQEPMPSAVMDRMGWMT